MSSSRASSQSATAAANKAKVQKPVPTQKRKPYLSLSICAVERMEVSFRGAAVASTGSIRTYAVSGLDLSRSEFEAVSLSLEVDGKIAHEGGLVTNGGTEQGQELNREIGKAKHVHNLLKYCLCQLGGKIAVRPQAPNHKQLRLQIVVRKNSNDKYEIAFNYRTDEFVFGAISRKECPIITLERQALINISRTGGWVFV